MKNFEKLVQKTEKIMKSIFAKCINQHQLIVSKNELIGKNSLLVKTFKNLQNADKRKVGILFEQIKNKIKTEYQQHFFQINQKIKKIKVNYQFGSQHTQKQVNNSYFGNLGQELPFLNLSITQQHPLSQIINQIHDFCWKMNWKFVPSSDLTTLEDNFTLLNIDAGHPARREKDCFYIDQDWVLRTHTTNMTAQALVKYSKDNKLTSTYTIGNVYRNDTDDSTHLEQFSQFDVCLIAENLSLAKLKWILIQFCYFIFEQKVPLRFRNSFFPFTEPSIELDVGCFFCQQKKCLICNKTGWIELLGGGVINPEVLKRCQIKKNIIALAFGIGIERIVMLKYQIGDIRSLYKNNLKVI